jgi:ATP-binding cassette subfamily C protein LapB
MSTAAWLAASDLAQFHGRRVSARDLQGQSADQGQLLLPELLARALQQHGFTATVASLTWNQLCQAAKPALILLHGGAVGLCHGHSADSVSLRLYKADAADASQPEELTWLRADFTAQFTGTAVLAKPDGLFDSAQRGDTLPGAQHWFWQVFKQLRRHYGDCVMAAVLVNLLALAGSMFSMNVYDRIVPNAALHSLWVLAIGVLIAGLLEVFLRTVRARIVDEAGKQADLQLSAAIYSQTLNLKPQDRPSSSGQYAGQLRDFESVREFVSSTTLLSFTDLPFVILFLIVIGFLGGPLIWVPVVAAVLILGISALSQVSIRQSIERYQYENSQKLAFMVESLERIETIQALGAQRAVMSRWQRLCAITARSAMGSRLAASVALNITQFIQQSANTVLIVWGVYLILEGRLTTGGLIGCSILLSRALAPMAQVAGLITRWQQARTSYDAVNRIMVLPGLYEPNRNYVQLSQCTGPLVLKDVQFSYPRTDRCVLQIDSLGLGLGEIAAVMGPVGSGKSTLLRLLAGLQAPNQGQVLLDGLDSRQISPADWRAHVGWVGQDAVLFRGSIRDNLLIAAPQLSEARLLHILRLTGLAHLVADHPAGLDMPLGENGQALSGGQRQLVALARALLSPCPILLMDEPTSAFDMAGEAALLQALKPELAGRLVLIATHRPGPLSLAERLIVLDRGRIVADGPRDTVLQAVQQGQVKRPAHFERVAA